MSWPKANGDWWKAKIAATIARDRRNDAVLRASGWTVLRIWEHDSTQLAADLVIEAIEGVGAEGGSRA